MSLVLLCLGAWLSVTASRGRLERGRRRRVPVSGRDVAAAVAGVGVLVVIGGMWGLVWGIAVGAGVRWALARMGDDGPQRREELLRFAPEAVECLAACVAAGAPLWPAMEVVARSFTGPVGDVLRRSVARHRVGASYEESFAEFLEDPLLAPVGAVLLRSVESGASLSSALTACAEQMRQVRGSELENRARAVGVKAVAPLAGCFLPAFIVLAVVPIVASLVTGLL